MHETPQAEDNHVKVRPVHVCLLGGRAAGKTCMLAGLAILAEANRRTSIVVRGRDESTIARLDELARTLRAQDWPSPTNRSQIIHLRIEVGNEVIHLTTLDYRGDSFLEELRRLSHDQIEELKAVFDNADTFLLVLDPKLDLGPLDQSEATPRETILSRLQAHLDTIGDAWANRTGRASKKPRRCLDVAVVLTKIDTLPHIKTGKDARGYCASHSGALIKKLEDRSDQVAFFPVTAIGGTESIERSGKPTIVPAKELTPTGYEPLLRWIVRRHRWRKNRVRRILAATIAVVALLSLAFAGAWRSYERARINQILDDPRRSRIEKIELSTNVPTLSDDLIRKRSELVRQEIADIKDRIERVTNNQEIEDLSEQVTKLEKSNPGSQWSRVEELRKQLGRKDEDLRFTQVKAAYELPRHTNFLTLARRYIDKFPGGLHKTDVDDYMRKYLEALRTEGRDIVRAILVDNPASLADKSKAILEYVNARHADDPAEITRMRRAADLALQFCQQKYYHVLLKRTGGFLGARHHKVQLFQGDRIMMDLWSTDQATEVHWETQARSTLTIEWKAGESLSGRLKAAHFIHGESEVSSMVDSSPIAIRFLGGKHILNIRNDWTNYAENPFFQFEVEGISPDDWKALSDYVLPGDRW